MKKVKFNKDGSVNVKFHNVPQFMACIRSILKDKNEDEFLGYLKDHTRKYLNGLKGYDGSMEDE